MTCSRCQAAWGCIQLLAQERCSKQSYSLSRQLSFSKGCASPHKSASLHSSTVLQSLASHPLPLSHRAGLPIPHSFSAWRGFSAETGFPEDLGSTQLVFLPPPVTQLPSTKSLLKLLEGLGPFNTSRERRASSSTPILLGISALSVKPAKSFRALFQMHWPQRQQHSRCIRPRVIPAA